MDFVQKTTVIGRHQISQRSGDIAIQRSSQSMAQWDQDTVARCHRLGGLNNGNLFPQLWRQQDLASDELLSWLVNGASHCVITWQGEIPCVSSSFIRTPILSDQGSTLMTSFSQLLKVSLSNRVM